MTPVITFTVYALIARNGSLGPLGSDRAFTALTLFNLFASAVSFLVSALTGTVTSIDCIDRIREFLVEPSREENRSCPPKGVGEDKLFDLDDEYCLETQSASMGWRVDEPAVLHDINIKIKNSDLVMIVGPVGCGKSTLVQALLGEVPFVNGLIRVNFDRTGYCAQDPWLTNGTVQQNILGVSEYDVKRYMSVIDACGLEKDLEHLPQSDQTVVGSKGVSLSGGQKQRLVSHAYSSKSGFPANSGRLWPELCTPASKQSFWTM
jgi:ATP-binding cassette subfamily C (CFTR/MRP) protein 1